MSRSGGVKGNSLARLDVSSVRQPYRHSVQGQGQGGEQSLPLPEGQGVQLAQGSGEVGAGLLGQVFQPILIGGVKGDGQGGVEQPFPAPLDCQPLTDLLAHIAELVLSHAGNRGI